VPLHGRPRPGRVRGHDLALSGRQPAPRRAPPGAPALSRGALCGGVRCACEAAGERRIDKGDAPQIFPRVGGQGAGGARAGSEPGEGPRPAGRAPALQQGQAWDGLAGGGHCVARAGAEQW